MKLHCLLLFTCALGAVTSDTVILNQMVDELLASANTLIAAAGKSTIPIPTISTQWHKKTWWYSITCTLTCQNGEIGELNTLKRTGDASLTTQGSTVTLKAQLGLGAVDFHFGICRAKAHLFSVHGEAGGTCSSNSISFQVSFTYSGSQCQAKLDSISLDQIGGIEINLGGGMFHKVEDKLVQMLIQHFNDDIKKAANKQLETIVGQALAKDSQKICQHIPH